jgi:hypothetical protein
MSLDQMTGEMAFPYAPFTTKLLMITYFFCIGPEDLSVVISPG